jgi:hypothetical protein
MTADAFGNLWGKCVSSMKKCIFISLEKCFCTVFCEFFEVIFDCTCALADISRNAGTKAQGCYNSKKPDLVDQIQSRNKWAAWPSG